MNIDINSKWIDKNLNNKIEKGNTVEPIQDLSSKLIVYANMDDAIDILNNFKKSAKFVDFDPTNGSYRYQNFYIIPGLRAKNTKFIQNLKFINKLGLCKTSAPEIVHYGLSQDNEFNVIIYKINNTKGGKLIPIENLKTIDSDKKSKFIEEQIVLLDETGLYNKAVTDSYDFWFLTPDTHNIFIDSWGNLLKCNTVEEKNNIKELLKNRI